MVVFIFLIINNLTLVQTIFPYNFLGVTLYPNYFSCPDRLPRIIVIIKRHMQLSYLSHILCTFAHAMMNALDCLFFHKKISYRKLHGAPPLAGDGIEDVTNPQPWVEAPSLTNNLRQFKLTYNQGKKINPIFFIFIFLIVKSTSLFFSTKGSFLQPK